MGSHPIKQFNLKIDATLELLVKMKFLNKTKQKIEEKKHNKISIKGRYGGGINNVVSRNKMRDSMSDIAIGTNHIRSFSSASSQSATSQNALNQSKFDPLDDEEKEIANQKTLRDENKNKFVENMPLTSTLVTEPAHKIRWKKGKLIKSKGGMLNKGSERVFVFKGKILYWFRNTNVDKYPLGRIKFDESILRLRANKKKNEIVIKVSRKKYVLRAHSVDEMREWFALFQSTMNSDVASIDEKEEEMGHDDDEKVIDVDFISSIHSGECFEFTHGFLRDAIYEQMLSSQRIRIHKSAQAYLKKVLKKISYLPVNYPNKESDAREFTALLQRHLAIAQHYQSQIQNIGVMVAEADGKKKSKKGKKSLYGFAGLD